MTLTSAIRTCWQTAAVLLLAIVAVRSAAAEDWACWRGPTRDGQLPAGSLPASWPKTLTQAWQMEAGLGHASPVFADGRVFVFSRVGEEEHLTCVDPQTGTALWSKGYAAPYEVNSAAAGHGAGPKATPAVLGGKVVTLGISGLITCWNATDGSTLWQRDYTSEFPATSPLYGAASSPLIFEDTCFVSAGGQDNGAIVALSMQDGSERWRWAEDGPAYASPILMNHKNSPQLVTQTQKFCVSLNPQTGKLLWQTSVVTAYDQNSVTPLAVQNRVWISGYGRGITALEVGADPAPPRELWQQDEYAFYMSSPVAAGGALFGFAHQHFGQFVALDLDTGKPLWKSSGRQGENAAILAEGNQVLALTTAGKLLVFQKQGESFKPVKEYTVADTPTWAHPLIVGQMILIKSQNQLTAWKVGAASGS